jgi:hypothetical protein
MKGTTGDVREYIESLILFLKKCAKHCFRVADSVPYMQSWGDWESGAVYLSSDEKIAKIIGINTRGIIRNEEIEW